MLFHSLSGTYSLSGTNCVISPYDTLLRFAAEPDAPNAQ